MTLKVSLCALLLGASLAIHAETRVHTVPPVQSLILEDFFSDFSPGKVAIDGDFSIVIANDGGGRVANSGNAMRPANGPRGPPCWRYRRPRRPRTTTW